MKKYVGTKIIEAKLMSRGDYNLYRGWTIPKAVMEGINLREV